MFTTVSRNIEEGQQLITAREMWQEFGISSGDVRINGVVYEYKPTTQVWVLEAPDMDEAHDYLLAQQELEDFAQDGEFENMPPGGYDEEF